MGVHNLACETGKTRVAAAAARAWQFAIALVAIALVGCGPSPLKRSDIAPLERIRVDYQRVVDEANANAATTWRSGWIGNVLVNWREGRERGLCYHWQELVFKGVEDASREVGWERVGIQLNAGRKNEHHAVVVYDPLLISQDELLERPPPRPAFVLDAWRRGRADIYRFDDWVKGSGWSRVRMVGLEDLEAEYAARDAKLTEDAAAGVVSEEGQGAAPAAASSGALVPAGAGSP